jgi:hypothetical protein
VAYIDTDSLFVRLGQWVRNYGLKDKWDKLSDEDRISFIKKFSLEMEKYIDNRIFNEVQLGDYNSQVNDFKISFKQEIIAKTALFIKKKKYAYWLLDKEGAPKDEISVTGLEIVRSDSAEAIRPRLKNVMEAIMKQKPDDEIKSMVEKYKKELFTYSPEELAANIGINNIEKYKEVVVAFSGENNYQYKKGTPWHVKGVYNYRFLLDTFNIREKYEDVLEGLKAKVVYVKQNPWAVDVITFHDWPEEFKGVLQFDKRTMIEKFFIKKIRFLLAPIGKEDILDAREGINLFF